MKLLDAIDKLRVHTREGRRSPHKPLLLLYALAEQARNPQTRVEFKFSEAEEFLKKLLDEFWNPSSHGSYRVHYPFWRLREDNKIWEVFPDWKIEETKSKDAKIASLKKHNATGSFSKDIVNEIKENPYIAGQAIQKLLEEYFPPPLHKRILDGIEFDYRISLFGDHDYTKKRSRDRKFRQKVLNAYKCSCVVCGFDVHINDKPTGLEAAHIKWHCEKGPDTLDNGLALCATHHELFDLGAFTLSEDYRIVLSERINSSNGESAFIKKYQKREIRLPEDENCFPKQEYVNWHRKAVFKGPQLRP